MGYLQSFLPKENKTKRITVENWAGLNRLENGRTEQISSAVNISTSELPVLVSDCSVGLSSKVFGHPVVDHAGFPSIAPVSLFCVGEDIIEIFRFESFLTVVYYNDSTNTSLTAEIEGYATMADEYPRSLVVFDEYERPHDPNCHQYTKKLLLLPDKIIFDYRPSVFTLSYIGDEIPDIKHAAVHNSRLYGVSGERVYVSGERSLFDWDFVGDEIEPASAFTQANQSNPPFCGEYTAVTVFDGSVICLRERAAEQVMNSKNPFRLTDIGEFGAINERCYAKVNDRLYLVRRDAIVEYGGGRPYNIGAELAIKDFKGAVCAGFNDTFYLCIGKKIYTFNTRVRQWGCIEAPCGMVLFAAGKSALLAQGRDGLIYEFYDISQGYCKWGFESGALPSGYLRRVCASVFLSEGSTLEMSLVEAENDSEIPLAYTEKSGHQTLCASLQKRGNGRFKLRFSGESFAKVGKVLLDFDV